MIQPVPEPNPFRLYERVRYQECDSQHVVFNARYGDYIDLAITEFLFAVMPERDPANNMFEIQLKKQTIEWFAPARFKDVLEIAAFPIKFGTTSFTMRFELRVDGKGAPIVTAEAVYVHITDVDGTWRSTPIPAVERGKLEAAAKGHVIDHAGHFATRR